MKSGYLNGHNTTIKIFEINKHLLALLRQTFIGSGVDAHVNISVHQASYVIYKKCVPFLINEGHCVYFVLYKLYIVHLTLSHACNSDNTEDGEQIPYCHFTLSQCIVEEYNSFILLQSDPALNRDTERIRVDNLRF